MDIVITEKTSQAKDVAAAVGNRYGKIYPAEGHLLTLKEPEDVNPGWAKWGAELLKPSQPYGFKPANGGNKKSKLSAIKEALKTTTRVWLATDCDREGQLIGQEILEWANFKGQVMRVMFTAQDPETIKRSFTAARPNGEYAKLYAAATARQQADQIYNLSLTRTATVLLAPGGRGVIGIGRVKTPTLGIVCHRELAIKNFKPEDYFEVTALASNANGGRFTMRHAPNPRIDNRSLAEAIRNDADGYTGPLQVKVEDRKQAPPKLHDLPSLQKICGQRFGWSASKTLEIAQELYDGDGKKIITYPRAETRYLAESLIPDAQRIAHGLVAVAPWNTIALPSPIEIRKGKTGHYWDKGLEGASHHAIIPNANTINDLPKILTSLNPDERKLFDIISRHWLAAHMDDHHYKQTTATLDVKGREFRASGRQTTSEGWKAAFHASTDSKDASQEGSDSSQQDGETDEQDLPNLQHGEIVTLRGTKVEAKQTKPPPRFNEGTLIEAMQNAWRYVKDEGLQERLKEAKGIGTPATRAEVIKGLRNQDLLTSQGKHIVPTDRGLALYNLLAQADEDLVDPGVTARWELLLDDVLTGSQTRDAAIDAVCNDAARLISRLAAKAPPSAGGTAVTTGLLPAAKQAPTAAMKSFAESLAKRLNVALPQGYAKSADICRSFLDTHATKKQGPSADSNSTSPRPPSAAQINFAEAIAKRRGITIPESAKATSQSIYTWIEKNKDNSAVKNHPAAASAKQKTPEQSAPKSQPTGTALRIPFGNKEAALKLGARYANGGWFAPSGVDLSPFKEKGWI